MTFEERLSSFRFEAPAAELKGRVWEAIRRDRRERAIWKWTLRIAAVVIAVAVPVNLWVDHVRPAAPPAAAESWPPEARGLLKPRPQFAAAAKRPMRSLEDLR